jgi:hypothetical protein
VCVGDSPVREDRGLILSRFTELRICAGDRMTVHAPNTSPDVELSRRGVCGDSEPTTGRSAAVHPERAAPASPQSLGPDGTVQTVPPRQGDPVRDPCGSVAFRAGARLSR